MKPVSGYRNLQGLPQRHNDEGRAISRVWTIADSWALRAAITLSSSACRFSIRGMRKAPPGSSSSSHRPAPVGSDNEMSARSSSGIVQCRLACADRVFEPRPFQVGESDGGWPVVASCVVFRCLELVPAGPPAFDDAGAGAVADGVKVPSPGDLGQGAGEELVSLLRGERPGRRPGGRCGRLW
jgi:hypothetical protein